MKVSKIMRKDVVPLRADATMDTAWRQMRDQGLGALPVTDAADRLLGVLTEDDLLGRLTPRRVPTWWTMISRGTDELAADYLKAAGVTAGDLMTVAPVTIVPDASVETAATLMRRHAIGAVPVVADDVCVGLVTRADVLDHLSWPTAAPGTVTDVELQRLMHEGILQELWTSRHCVTVEAAHGVIRLTGVVKSPAERSALVAMARSVPGCTGVENRLVVYCRTGRHQPAQVV
jgi:CBS domain-containing protein